MRASHSTLLLWLIVSAPAIAQTGMVDNPCPAATDPSDDAFVDKMLKPGADFQKFLAERAAKKPADDDAYARRAAEQRARDWPNLCRYAAENAALRKPARIVFMGDSITEYWKKADPALFTDGVVNRGISGQTSSQMLLRFYADVIALEPRIVHIMAGTNDVAGNTGPTTEQAYKNNIIAMAELARAHGIEVVLGSIPPAASFWWAPQHRPAAQIRSLNAWLKSYAQQNKFDYVDYYAAMTTPDGALDGKLANDGVHPNSAGYDVMRKLVSTILP